MNKKWRTATLLLVLGVGLTLDSLYQASTTAQALMMPLSVFPLNMWQIIVVNVLVVAGIGFLVSPRNRV